MYCLLLNLFMFNIGIILWKIYNFLFYNKPKKVIILRGLPGSGKTDFINYFIENLNLHNYEICSFLTYYDNNTHSLPQSYNNCYNQFMSNILYGTSYIFVDNPNIQKWELDNYLKLAKFFNYDIEIYSIDTPDIRYLEYYRSRSTYKVSKNTMNSMYNRWEKINNERIIVPYVETDILLNGDSLPFPKLTLEQLDKDLDKIKIKKYN